MKQLIIDVSKNQEIEISEDTEILGFFLGKGARKVNSKIKVIHKRPNLKSFTLIKTVLYDDSEFNLLGDLIIEKGAYLTDAYLKMEVLLMSPNAKATAVPSLEITENNVKGGHGATISMLDPEQMFYLQTRNLSKIEAEKLLVEGFIQDLIQKVTDPQVQKKLLNGLQKKIF